MKKSHRLPRAGVLLRIALAVGLVSLAGRAFAVTFSIDSTSPTVPTVGNNDVLSPGPVGGPPGVALSAAALGLPAVSADEVDAFTFGAAEDEGVDGVPFGFSVDRTSVGAPGSAVAAEAAVGQAAGDLFGTASPHLNQDVLGLLPAVPRGTSVVPPIDNIDAFDICENVLSLDCGSGTIAFSLSAGNSLGVSGADILGLGGTSVLTASDLGLVVLDDIDALQRGIGNHLLGDFSPVYYFSLAPGSPSLAGGLSAADVFISAGDGTFALYVPHSTFGLLPTDNIDALASVPEPAVMAFLVLAISALVAWRLPTQRPLRGRFVSHLRARSEAARPSGVRHHS